MTTLLFSLDSLQIQFPFTYFWIDTFLKASLLVSVAWILHGIYRHQSASSQGLIWLIALAACLSIPVFKLLVPALEFEVTVTHIAPLENGSVTQTGSVLGEFSWTRLISLAGWFYLGGILLMFTGLAASIFSLCRISRVARPAGGHRAVSLLADLRLRNGTSSRIDLLFSDKTPTPFTWGIIRHRLILPEAARSWETGLLRQALAHELGHIQRNDWLFQLLGRLALCFYWPHPLVWQAVRMLKVSSEKACDDAVTDNAEPAVAYATNLLRLVNGARTTTGPLALTMSTAMTLFSRPSILTQRIRHLLHPDRNRSFLRADEIFTATLLTLLLVIPFSAIDVSARTVEPSPTTWSVIPVRFGIDDNSPLTHSESSTDTRLNHPVPGGLTAPGPVADPVAAAPQSPPTAIPVRQAPLQQRGSGVIDKLISSAIGHDFQSGSYNDTNGGLDNGLVSGLGSGKDSGINSGFDSEFAIRDQELFSQWEATPLITPTPVYPRRARRNGIEGHVVAAFRIDDEGKVFDTKIIESVPTGVFDSSVLRAVEKFVYCPEIVDGIGGNNQPITKRFSFTLRDRVGKI